jgi:hypothetical protein
MTVPLRGPWSTFILLLILSIVPGAARAQTAATTSFEELRRILKHGHRIVVTDTTGQRVTGKVREVSTSPPSLVIAIPEPRTVRAEAIAEIRTVDCVINGALIGAGIGASLAVWDYLIDPSEPGNGAIFAVAIGLGTAVGAGIDALIDGRRVLYRSGAQKGRVTIAPIATRDRRGLQVVVRF